MTKERRLAIEMWCGISRLLSACDSLSGSTVKGYKQVFCEEHDLKWKYSCWFCQYIRDCIKCPLGNCGLSSDYDDAVNDRLKKDVRIAACNNIIKALGGKA